MTIENIANGEIGSGVRTKLNDVIHSANASIDVATLMTDTQLTDLAGGGTLDGNAIYALVEAEVAATNSTLAFWPAGYFVFDNPIVVAQPHHMRGHYSGTSFYFPNGGGGIEIPLNKWGMILDGIVFYSASIGGQTTASTDLTEHGCHMKTTAVIRDCAFNFFGGHGIYIQASTGAGTNAVTWLIEGKSSAYRNGGDGLRVEGNNTSAGNCIGFDSTLNGGCGFYDDSLLGNTYTGCHSSSNGWNLGSCIYGGYLYHAGLAIDTTTAPDPAMLLKTGVWYRALDPNEDPYAGGQSATNFWKEWSSGRPYRYCSNYYADNATRTTTTGASIFVNPYSEDQRVPDWFNDQCLIVGERSLANGILNGKYVIPLGTP